MTMLQTQIIQFIRHWPVLFSARGTVVALCLLAIIPATHVPWLKVIDDGLYRMAADISVDPQGSDRLMVLTLPPAARVEDYVDPPRLAQIRASGAMAVVLITNQNIVGLSADLARYGVIVGRTASAVTGKLATGTYDFTAEGIVNRPHADPWYVQALRLVHASPSPLALRQDAVPGYRSLPVADSYALVDYPLVWYRPSDGMQDLVSFLYNKHGDAPARTDISHKLRGLHLPATRLRPAVSQYAFRDLIADRDYSALRDRIVLIGSADDPAMINAATMLDDMLAGQTAMIPYWAVLVKALLALFAMSYLLLLHRLRAQTSMLLTSIAVGAILVAQFGFMLIQQAWLPLGTVLAALVLGHFIVFASHKRHQQTIALSANHDMTLRTLARYQIDGGELEHALVTLQQSDNSDEALALLYRLGIEYERQRKYTRALECFKHLHSRQRNYQDVRARINTLEHAGDPTGTLSAFNGARTLIMPSHGVETPVLGRYEIERELGRGAMGVVYLGRDPKIQRQVAIKTVELKQFSSSEAQNITARFFREAEAAGKLNHPNIVTIFDAGEDGDLAYIAMDYAAGKPLSTWTAPDQLLPIETVCHIIAQVAQAIDYAHRQGIVHRDIKPGNIIYDPDDERVRITDFGIARITDSNATRTGTLLGSPSYMAPEQVTQSKVDGRADIFSLGVTLYQLLTGELPFQGDSLASVAYQITNKKHNSVRELRPELSIKITRIVNKALQKKPEKRYESAADMATALQKV
ncbi:MAG: protein kinase [Granulosicoccaceae bacterium]